MTKKTLVLLSGGLDSSALLLYLQLERSKKTEALFFDRKQGALAQERAAARWVSERGGVNLYDVSIREWRESIPGKVNMENIPRNAIMALLALPYAIALDCHEIAIGSTHDDANTKDSNKDFIKSINGMLRTLGHNESLCAPFLDVSWGKVDIARWAKEKLGEEFIEKTHSCYRPAPGKNSCGTCSACRKRLSALAQI